MLFILLKPFDFRIILFQGGDFLEHQHDEYWHSHGDGPMHSHHHTHDHSDSEHNHDHHHMHSHDPEETKKIVNRLSRAIGHLESVKRMVEDNRDCTEVLVQLAAVRSALNSTAKVILKEHMEHCMSDAIAGGNMEELEALNEAIDRYIG